MNETEHKIRGVITGDIVNSTSIPMNLRSELLHTINDIIFDIKEKLHNEYETRHTNETDYQISFEFYRGDSFQILVSRPERALEIAVLIRAGLRKSTPAGSHKKWDARLSIGIGTVEYNKDRLSISDGKAYQYSGREFEKLGKNRLAIKTPWEEVNDDLKLNTLFADDIISNWTPLQSEAIYTSILDEKTQEDIAKEFCKSRQNINKLLTNAKENLIRMYIERFVRLIDRNNK